MEILKSSVIYSIIFIAGITLFGVYTSLIRKVSNKIYCNALGIKMSICIDSKITFIGVVHHELSHLILALFSGAKIVNVNLFKFNSKDGKLGHIDIIPRGNIILRSIQAGLSAIGPLLIGSITSLYLGTLLINRFTYREIWFWIIAILIVQITYHMNMSKADIKAALKGLPIVLIILIAINYYLLYSNFEYINAFNLIKNDLLMIILLCSVNLFIAVLSWIIAKPFRK